VLHAEEFQKSLEFELLTGFLKEVYNDKQLVTITEKNLFQFFNQLGHRKSILDLREEIKFEQSTTDLTIPPILATGGGYNDTFLRFISNLLNSQVLKCTDQTKYVINSIDFINKTTNDCFYKLIGPVNTKINSAGKID